MIEVRQSSFRFVEEPVNSDAGDGVLDLKEFSSWVGDDIFQAGEGEDQPADASIPLECDSGLVLPSRYSFFVSWDEEPIASAPSTGEYHMYTVFTELTVSR